jgi:hypothetical protein
MMYADSECSYTQNYEDNTYTFTGICLTNNKERSVTVPAEGLYKYRQGALIQVAFPGLSPQDREFLISGMVWERGDFEEE